MAATTVATALDRIARLTPVTAAGPSHLTGDYAAVCTPWQTLPAEFQQAQRERTAFYMAHTFEEGGRCKPDHAPRYYVTAYGLPIAWVTLDGQTHYTENLGNHADGAQLRTIRRHQDTIRAAWPERFQMNREGDPINA